MKTYLQKQSSLLKIKILILLIIAFLPRIIGLGEHAVFADEISWMARSKDVYASVRSRVWANFRAGWWLDPNNAEPIGLPMAFFGGLAVTFLSPGYSHYSLNLTRDFVAARVPSAILGSLFVPIFYFLARKFIGDKKAFLVSIMIAVDPISIALSRWLHQDMALVVFSTLSLMVFIYSRNKIAVITSSLLASLAILTKPQGLFVPLTLLTYSAIVFLKYKKLQIKNLLLWFILTAVFTVTLFPFLWKNPIGGMINYLWVQMGVVAKGHLTFFNGKVTTSPPWYYYFFIFPFRIPETYLVGIMVGFVGILQGLKNKFFKNDLLLILFIFSIFTFALISSSDKKLGIRYLFVVWPFIYIISVSGLLWIEKFISKSYKKVFWAFIFLFPIWGILKFYPSYYLYYNHFITPTKFQNLESIGFCDGVKPAIKYLEPALYHGIKIMLPGCDSAINYYTGFTIDRVYALNQKPEFIIEETQDAQKFPLRNTQIRESGYIQIKSIDFRGLHLADIYKKP